MIFTHLIKDMFMSSVPAVYCNTKYCTHYYHRDHDQKVNIYFFGNWFHSYKNTIKNFYHSVIVIHTHAPLTGVGSVGAGSQVKFLLHIFPSQQQKNMFFLGA